VCVVGQYLENNTMMLNLFFDALMNDLT